MIIFLESEEYNAGYELVFFEWCLIRNNKMPVKVRKEIKVCLAAYNNSKHNNDLVEGIKKCAVDLVACFNNSQQI
jgi:hypothetical protein